MYKTVFKVSTKRAPLKATVVFGLYFSFQVDIDDSVFIRVSSEKSCSD